MDMTGDAKKRIAYIETIRGLACVLLVAYHVIGSGPAYGLRLPDDHVLRVVNSLLRDVRMPLFSFISGFVFSAVVIDYNQWKGKVMSKARRLLLPMIFVGTIHFLFQYVTVGAEGSIASIYFFPYAHFWFLQATFLLMLAHLTASWVFSSARLSALILGFCFSCAYILVDPGQLNVFSWSSALYLAPYFFAGHLLASGYTTGLKIEGAPRWAGLSVSVLVLAVLLYVTYLQVTRDVVFSENLMKSLRVVTGLTACSILMLMRPVFWPLARLGFYSFAIYLFHVIFTAGTRVVVTKIVPEIDLSALFALCTLAGLIGPIFVYHLVIRSSLLSLALLGIKRRRSTIHAFPQGAT